VLKIGEGGSECLVRVCPLVHRAVERVLQLQAPVARSQSACQVSRTCRQTLGAAA
jgi:hypothetical protein